MLSRIIRLNASRGVGVPVATAAFRVRRGAGCSGGAAVPGTHPSAVGVFSGFAAVASAHSSVASSSSIVHTAVRGVQFEQTSQTIGGLNKKTKAQTSKWVTKSTKDYMEETDRKIKGNASVTSIGRERIKEKSVERKERYTALAEAGEEKFQLEMDRIRDDNSSRWRKGIHFFQRQGKAFFALYIVIYVGMFLVLYAGFASGFIKKEMAFEFVFIAFGTYINRDNFYKRIEAWDTYVNVAFAFVINDILEILRLPFVMLLFYQCRPLLTGMNRRVKKSLFRWNAAES